MSSALLSLTVTEESKRTFIQANEHTQDMFFSVQSLRLDAVVGCAFSLSRTKAAAFIEGGSVYVDGVQALKTDKRLAVGEKIVLRGKGKALLLEQKEESKKGRLHIIIRRYL